MNRKLLWASVGLLALLSVALLWSLFGTHSISLTEAQVQERINAQLGKEFPVKGKARLIVQSVTAQNVTVHIANGQMTANIEIEGMARTEKVFAMSVLAVGVPAYSAGDFFFKPQKIEVQKFAFAGATPAEQISRFAGRYLSDEKKRLLVEDAAPRIEEWMTEVAQTAAVHSLERPIYRPKNDAKGILIRAAIESVKIDNDRIVVTFSLLQLTISVLIGALCLVGAFVLLYALLQNPTLGTAVLLLG